MHFCVFLIIEIKWAYHFENAFNVKRLVPYLNQVWFLSYCIEHYISSHCVYGFCWSFFENIERMWGGGGGGLGPNMDLPVTNTGVVLCDDVVMAQ